MSMPDKKGHFGIYGGKFAPETLMPALAELEAAYLAAKKDREFQSELDYYFREFIGRPTSLYFAKRLTDHLGGAKIYLKREDLCHTGAHKINNSLAQVLLAKRMGKTRVIAETGAGQHGVATATAAAMFGLDCEVYMGTDDVARQSLNVFRMKLLGTIVRPVDLGSKTLKDAINEAMRDWITNVASTHYVLGTAFGPHPFPMMVRDFQAVIGREAKKQIMKLEGRLPDALIVIPPTVFCRRVIRNRVRIPKIWSAPVHSATKKRRQISPSSTHTATTRTAPSSPFFTTHTWECQVFCSVPLLSSGCIPCCGCSAASSRTVNVVVPWQKARCIIFRKRINSTCASRNGTFSFI